jgi:hypothetical protein
MRLTAFQGAQVNLELFVIAKAQAVPIGYRLKNEYCNSFYYEKISSRYHRNTEEEVYGFQGSRYFGRNMGIGHSDARKIMDDGDVLNLLTFDPITRIKFKSCPHSRPHPIVPFNLELLFWRD